MENLVCQKCSKNWQRPLTRGRKPRFCPDCVTTMVISYDTSGDQPETYLKTVEDSSVVYRFPGPTKWRCAHCDASVATPINLDYEPTHSCKNRGSRLYALDLVSRRA